MIRHAPGRRLSEHNMPVGIRERKAFRPVDAVGATVGDGEPRRPLLAFAFGHAQDAGIRLAAGMPPARAAVLRTLRPFFQQGQGAASGARGQGDF